MKIIFRTTIKIIPGKMTEYMEVEKRIKAVTSRYEMPYWTRRYKPFTGESVHTIVYDTEWDSLSSLEAAYEKISSDPAGEAAMANMAECIVSHDSELYTLM